jgi:hypothetical protein
VDGVRETIWLEDYYNAIRPYGTGVYVNFLADDTERIREAYPGATYERLVMVKRRFDPENVFCQNQNISPEPRYGASASGPVPKAPHGDLNGHSCGAFGVLHEQVPFRNCPTAVYAAVDAANQVLAGTPRRRPRSGR